MTQLIQAVLAWILGVLPPILTTLQVPPLQEGAYPGQRRTGGKRRTLQRHHKRSNQTKGQRRSRRDARHPKRQ